MGWVLLLAAALEAAAAEDRSILLASTTTAEKTGLFAYLLPAFKQASGIEVKVVATSTAEALDAARRGEADAVLVHDKVEEDRFVAEGFGLKRQEVMRNDFVLVGPAGDPAKAAGTDILEALRRLAAAKATFVSRGDKSGTHAAELRYWKAAAVEAPAAAGVAYKECKCGMGQALALAAAEHAYVLADRGTWLGFKDRADLSIVVERDSRLANPFAVTVVNPARSPKAKRELAQTFADWLVSPQGQAAIATYRVHGEPLFRPSAAAQ
ncbi:MAG TPA: substrate-binding domain-containing protein [Burkholderiaceae bacterium]|nr:substrate-binding domain-containing protein [Burkholderiaceae bacterium]